MLIQPQTTKQMSDCSLGLCVWLSFLRLALPGWPGQSLQTFPYDTCNSLASNFLAPAGAQKPGVGGGGTLEGEQGQEGAGRSLALSQTLRRLLCVSPPTWPLLPPSLPHREVKTAHYLFILQSAALGVQITSGHRACHLKQLKDIKQNWRRPAVL